MYKTHFCSPRPRDTWVPRTQLHDIAGQTPHEQRQDVQVGLFCIPFRCVLKNIVYNRNGWKRLNAMKHKRAHLIDANDIYDVREGIISIFMIGMVTVMRRATGETK